MKITAKEALALRCLWQFALVGDGKPLTISGLSRMENISEPYAAKILRLLRKAGFIRSARGVLGGYCLARSAAQISINEVRRYLRGGRIDSPNWCPCTAREKRTWPHTENSCRLGRLYLVLSQYIAGALDMISLQDLAHQGPNHIKDVVEQNMEFVAEFRKTVRAAPIPRGSGMTVEVDTKRVAAFNLKGDIFAVDDQCLCKSGSLGKGVLEGGVVVCPSCGWKYCVKTGVLTQDPAIRLRAYQPIFKTMEASSGSLPRAKSTGLALFAFAAGRTGATFDLIEFIEGVIL